MGSRSENLVPRLTNASHAIFVPITEDLLAPTEPPTTEKEYLQRSIDVIYAHANHVKHNILKLMTLEKEVIVRQYQSVKTPTSAHRWTRRAEKELAASLAAPAEPGVNYEIKRVEDIPDKRTGFDSNPGDILQRDYIVRVMQLAEATVKELQGYEGHVERVIEMYRMRLAQLEKKAVEGRLCELGDPMDLS